MLEHCVVKLCPHDLLCFGVFLLHVTNCNGHDFAISWIINMASHHCLNNDMHDMVKHNPKVFQFTAWLHSYNKRHSTPNPIDRHLENGDLLTINLA
jgi:hypothetical protein